MNRIAFRLSIVLLHVVMAGLGAFLSVGLFGTIQQRIGPFDVEMAPRLHSETYVDIPPFGSATFDSHRGPLGLTMRIERVDPEAAEQIAEDPESLRGLSDPVGGQMRSGITRLAVRLLVVSILGAAVPFVVFRRRLWDSLVGVVVVAVLVGGAELAGATTVQPKALSEPDYEGALRFAPAIVGDVELSLSRLRHYEAQLSRLVANTANFYQAVGDLPVAVDGETIKVLLVADIHSRYGVYEILQPLVKAFQVDMVIDAGDLTEWGAPLEQELFTGIGTMGVPYVFVKGNHDSQLTARQVAGFPNAIVLGGRPVEVAGLRILGDADPLYTPDQASRESRATEDLTVAAMGQRLAAVARADGRIDVAVVHNPVAAFELTGSVPLVLAGHLHQEMLFREDGTMIYVEGSTGGAGLRTVEKARPVSLPATILIFDKSSHRLVAYQQITMGGLGQYRLSIRSRVLEPA
jgi:predicted phosphodiesterase